MSKNEENGKSGNKPNKVMINHKNHDWDGITITGVQIKTLAGSPADYVVNQIVEGPGDDPEIGDAQMVDLTGPGIEKFVTRKPTTTPGL